MEVDSKILEVKRQLNNFVLREDAGYIMFVAVHTAPVKSLDIPTVICLSIRQ